MCYSKCIKKGFCGPTPLRGDVWKSKDGKRLSNLAPGAHQKRSYYKGDATWQKKGKIYYVVEYHRAEIIALQMLKSKRIACNRARAKRKTFQMQSFQTIDILSTVKKELRNRHLYRSWMTRRMIGLYDNGLVERHEGGFWKITNAGMRELLKIKKRQLEL